MASDVADPAGAAAASLRTYLEGEAATRAPLPLPRATAALRAALSPQQRELAEVVVTRVLEPVNRTRAARLAARPGPLLLNLGSGTHNADGWVNLDLWGLGRAWGVRPDLHWDLRRPLPFPDGSALALSTEHVLEHLPAAVGLAALARWRRVLRPGGVLRVSVPDAGRYLRAYAASSGPDAGFLEAQRPGRPTRLLAVSEVAYGHGHRSLWDEDTLVELLRAAGYTGVEVSAHGRTAAPSVPDNPQRAGESLYVEGRKPSPDPA